MQRAPLLVVVAFLFSGACESTRSSAADEGPVARDAHSHAEPDLVRVTHVSLDLTLDFDRRRAEGTVRLDLSRRDPSAQLTLDVRDLELAIVTGSAGGSRKFVVGPVDPKIAAALRIDLHPSDTSVTIAYSTTQRAEAMQWLDPEQTAGRAKPFLFTQGQSILTRSWIPLQDTPGVRVTYDAKIRVPEGMTPVMSAEHLGRGPDGAWRFRMQQPIPCYLIALACGDLEFREISRRCGVWAEPPVVAAARDELADVEAMVQSAETLFGPYRWERFDVIILPPSFPYGGMENPRLTFATPTILTGDKSLVGLVAHELAHSWSGNLVTNATWRDFWLNEGFTVHCEQRIMERVFGPERSEMEMALDVRGLEKEMETLEPWQEVLHVDLTGRHPDEASSQVPYIKGALFLRRIEELVGRKAFDPFLRSWFDRHAFRSVTTDDFLDYLRRELLDRHPDAAAKLDIAAWIREPGLPADLPRKDSKLLAVVDGQVERWKRGTPASELETGGWVTQQWLRFLDALPESLTVEQMTALDRAFHFTQSSNAEILTPWFVAAIRNRYGGALGRMDEFLLNVGRRKFLKPIYTEMAKTDEFMARGREIYKHARPRYHSVATGTIDGIMKWKPVATESR